MQQNQEEINAFLRQVRAENPIRMVRVRELVPEEFTLPEELKTIDSFDKLKRLARILPSYSSVSMKPTHDFKQVGIATYIEELDLQSELQMSNTLITDWCQLLELEQLNPEFLLYLFEKARFDTIPIKLSSDATIPICWSLEAITKFQLTSTSLCLYHCGAEFAKTHLKNNLSSEQQILVDAFRTHWYWILHKILYEQGNINSLDQSFFYQSLTKFLPPETTTVENLLTFDRDITRLLKRPNYRDKNTLNCQQQFVMLLVSLGYPQKLLSEIPSQWENLDDALDFLQIAGDLTLMLLWDKIVPFVIDAKCHERLILRLGISRSLYACLIDIEPLDFLLEDDGASTLPADKLFEINDVNNTELLHCALRESFLLGQLGGVGVVDKKGNLDDCLALQHRIAHRQIDGLIETIHLLHELNHILENIPAEDRKPEVEQQIPLLCAALLNLAKEQVKAFQRKPLLIELKYRLPKLQKIKALCKQEFVGLLNAVRLNLSLFQTVVLSAYQDGLISHENPVQTTSNDVDQCSKSVVDQIIHATDLKL